MTRTWVFAGGERFAQGRLEFGVKVRCGFAGTPVRIPRIASVNPLNISYFHIGNRRAY